MKIERVYDREYILLKIMTSFGICVQVFMMYLIAKLLYRKRPEIIMFYMVIIELKTLTSEVKKQNLERVS